MKDYRLESAKALPDNHSVRVRWNDGLEGIVDFADLMDQGIFRQLRDPKRFQDVRLYDYGHSLYWVAEDGSEIDICPDVLRAKLDRNIAAWIAEQENRYSATQAAE